MHYPYDRYIRTLLIKGHGVGAIRDRLTAMKLASPTEVELDRIKDSMLMKLPEKALTYIRPGPKYSFQKFLKAAGDSAKTLDIDEALQVLAGNRSKEWDDAMLILTDSDYRLMVTCMSVYGYSYAEIIQILKDRFHIEFTEETMRLFHKYYWDLFNMTKLELYHYIGSCPIRKHRFFLMDSFHRKEKSVTWKLTGKNMLTAEDILTTVMNESFDKFRESVQSEEPDSVNRTEKWANLAIRSSEKLRDITSVKTPEVAAALELKLKKITQDDIPTVDEMPDEIV